MVRNHVHHSAGDRLIHWARMYDLRVGILGTRGSRLRTMFADDLAARTGERLLDVGCGTGRLAMVFAERVSPTGSVDGIDASPEMIQRAEVRARRSGLPVNFKVGFAQRLPFPDAAFDGVACTLALHHVAEDDRPAAVEEMYRVLKTGGRLLIAEFNGRQRHGHSGLKWWRRSPDDDMIDTALELVHASGFVGTASGPTNLGWLGKITARKELITQ
jgi:ubiquinone/menaquinone biosynthesis C-methylase UbiE